MRMIIATLVLVAAATICWILIRRCPLARAIGLHIAQVSAASR